MPRQVRRTDADLTPVMRGRYGNHHNGAVTTPAIKEGKNMNYKCNKKVFATLEEANAYANAIMRATGEVLIVTTTKQAVTHTYTK